METKRSWVQPLHSTVASTKLTYMYAVIKRWEIGFRTQATEKRKKCVCDFGFMRNCVCVYTQKESDLQSTLFGFNYKTIIFIKNYNYMWTTKK